MHPLLRKCYSAISGSCRLIVVAVFVLFPALSALGQTGATDSLKRDTVIHETAATDSLLSRPGKDSLAIAADSSLSDSTKAKNKEEELGIKISKDALPAAVTTTAKDSAVLDMKHSLFYLYGDAKAKYEETNIQSGTLIFNQKTNILSALPLLDTAGKKISVQEFKQGEETFTYDTLKYNFKSKRAIVRNAHSKYGDGFVISEQVKRNPDESIYGLRSIYTTCNLDHPHFGIRAKKIKVIPGRVIASGPANLEIMDIPTPLFLPFGLFPIKQGQRSGFILPTYTLEANKGLGLLKGGYYFAVSDHLGIISQFDIYSKGSWGAYATAQYAQRYRYSGSLALEYTYTKQGEIYELNGSTAKDFKLTWSHQVDPKAHPGTTFSAFVNFATRTFNQNTNTLNIANNLNNQYNSSISYGKTWVGKPYSLTISARHSQNTQSGSLSISLPEINFNLGQFSPFQRKVMNGSPRWYEKITVSYSVNAVNRLNTYDSLFSLGTIAFRDMDNGIKHTASIQTNYNIFRYFNWNISVPYNEYWNTKQLFTRYNPVTGGVDSTMPTGFFASRDFSVTSGISTRIYGMKLFKKGKIAGIRHVITPSIGFTYQPGFAHSPFGYYYETINQQGTKQYLSPYTNSPISGPGNPQNQGSVNFSLGNTLQMKVRNHDSTGTAGTKIINLIDGLNVSANYNLFADSFRLSPIIMNFRTSILQIFNISAGAVFDPYRYENGFITPKYLINTGGGLAKLSTAQFGLSMSFRGAKKNEKEQKDAEKNNGDVKRLLQNGGINDYYDFNIPWNLSISAGMDIRNQHRANNADTMIFTPNFSFNGDFNLTERWKVAVRSGLQFDGLKKIGLSPASEINISRDLHCWQMSLGLIPFGYYRSFNFTLQVKSAVLQDLKLTRRRAYQDNFN